MKIRWTSIEERYILFTILFFIAFRVCDAPIRYYLIKAGFSQMSFLPNMLILSVLAIYFCKAILSLRLERTAFWVTVIFCYAAIVGSIVIGNAGQIILSFYGILPFFFGVVSWSIFTKNFERLKLFIMICWLISVTGVFLSIYLPFPWVGFSYERLGMEVEGSREWASFGITRFAGFSRTSYEVASLILLFLLMLAALVKRRLVLILLFIISGAAIVVTTTKTLIGVYLLVIVYLLTRSWCRTWSAVSIFLTLIMTILPISTQFLKYDLGITSDIFVRFLLLSFEDRLLNTWPEAFNLIKNHGSFLFGRGMGGIGGAQKFYEKSILNPADNLFLYLYVFFGVGAFIILYAFMKRTVILAHSADNPLNVFFFLLSLSVITYGLTSNVIEAPLFGFFIGTALLFRPQSIETGGIT